MTFGPTRSMVKELEKDAELERWGSACFSLESACPREHQSRLGRGGERKERTIGSEMESAVFNL